MVASFSFEWQPKMSTPSLSTYIESLPTFCVMLHINSFSSSRIDAHFQIRISDFGLSEDVFVKNYFRQGSAGEEVKLPVKWMAPESLSDGHFSEKSDVVRTEILIYMSLIRHFILMLFYTYTLNLTVVIWCDYVGDIQWG